MRTIVVLHVQWSFELYYAKSDRDLLFPSILIYGFKSFARLDSECPEQTVSMRSVFWAFAPDYFVLVLPLSYLSHASFI